MAWLNARSEWKPASMDASSSGQPKMMQRGVLPASRSVPSSAAASSGLPGVTVYPRGPAGANRVPREAWMTSMPTPRSRSITPLSTGERSVKTSTGPSSGEGMRDASRRHDGRMNQLVMSSARVSVTPCPDAGDTRASIQWRWRSNG